MPNHCSNEIVITGEQSELQKFWDGLKKFSGYNESEDGVLSLFMSYLPMPVELQGTMSPQDTPNWYDWALENWGSKWGDYDTALDLLDDQITGCYTSAWGPCNEGIVKLSKLFPELTFSVKYHEPGMAFMGGQVCQNGAEDAWSREMTKEDMVELCYDMDED